MRDRLRAQRKPAETAARHRSPVEDRSRLEPARANGAIDAIGASGPATEASDGQPVDAALRAYLEPRFGHDFGRMRIHADSEADTLARELDAAAFTTGSHVFFRAGAFDPASSRGLHLLTHEAAHVVQQSGAGPSLTSSAPAEDQTVHLSEPGDSAEQAAEGAASAVAAGQAASLPALPSSQAAVVHRWPWDDDSGGGSLWDSATSALSSAADFAGSAASTVYEGYQRSTDFRGLADQLNTGVDWVEQQTAKGNQQMVKDAEGIPVLEQLAQASAFISTQSTNLTGGVIKGAGDLAAGAANAFFHPIDAAAGMLGILEHNSTAPFLGTTLKGIHGFYDLAVNDGGQYGNSLGELANHVFNPLQQQEDDAKYNSALVRGIVTPGAKSWDESWQRLQDNPLDTLGRATVNVAPMLLGAGELALGEDAGQAARAGASVPPEAPPPTLRTPYAPPGVPEPPPFNPEITGPPSAPVRVPPPEGPVLPGPEPVNPSGPPTYQPTGSRGGWAWDPQGYPGEPTPSAPPGFENLPRPYPAPRTPTPLHPESLPDLGILEEPPTRGPERPLNTILEEPPASVPPPPDTIPGGPPFPKPPGTPLAPEPVHRLPSGPPEGPPIPREDPLSSPPSTLRQPMDIPGLPPEEPLPSTQPRGPETQPAPPSSGGSETPTLPGLGGVPAIPRGFDPGVLIQLLLDTPGPGSVVQLMQELGFPIRRA